MSRALPIGLAALVGLGSCADDPCDDLLWRRNRTDGVYEGRLPTGESVELRLGRSEIEVTWTGADPGDVHRVEYEILERSLAPAPDESAEVAP